MTGAPNSRRGARLLLGGVLAAALATLGSCATLPKVESAPLPPATVSAPSWERIAEGVEYSRLTLDSPPLQLHALRVDLYAAGLAVVVSSGSGELGKTRGRSLGTFMRESGCVAGVNGGPFSPSFAVAGEAMSLVGLAVSEGRLVSAPNPKYAALIFPASGGAAVVQQSSSLDVAALGNAVGGFFVVLRDGRVVGRSGRREPRTGAGVSADGRKLYLLVADGRRRDSVGLREAEVGSWLAWLGAADGLCLDGGGSSAMSLRRSGGASKLVNVPMHGGLPGWQRVLGNCLGFRALP